MSTNSAGKRAGRSVSASSQIHVAAASTDAEAPPTLVRRSAAKRPTPLQKVRTETGSPKRGNASTLILQRRTIQTPRCAKPASIRSR